MPNHIKYDRKKRERIVKLYSVGRSEGGKCADGRRFNSRGKYTLRDISEKTGVPIATVHAIAKGIR